MSNTNTAETPQLPEVTEIITPDLIKNLIENNGTLVIYLEDETVFYYNAEAGLRNYAKNNGVTLNGRVIGLRDPSSNDADLPKLEYPQVQIASFAANYIATKDLGQLINNPSLPKHVVVDLNLFWNPTEIESNEDFSAEEQEKIEEFATNNNLELTEARELYRICDINSLTPEQILLLTRIVRNPYYTSFNGIRFMFILLKNAPDTKITVCSSLANDINILNLIAELCSLFGYLIPEFVVKDINNISLLFTKIATQTQVSATEG